MIKILLLLTNILLVALIFTMGACAFYMNALYRKGIKLKVDFRYPEEEDIPDKFISIDPNKN